jgi:protein-disulfide isomerase
MKRKNKRKQEGMSSRQVMIGVVIAGALLVAIALVLPGILSTPSVAGVVTPTTVVRPAVDGLVIGDPNAPVRIDVFEDFQCPACKRFTEETEHRIVTDLVQTGKAYYVFHNYAFLDRSSVTKESQQAALASLCANEQGKFWEYHDTLFANWNGENQGAFADAHLIDFATVLNLDVDAFKICLSEGRYVDEVQASFKEGNQMGVQGTPSVFVNGTIIQPGYIPSYEEIAAAVEAAQ